MSKPLGTLAAALVFTASTMSPADAIQFSLKDGEIVGSFDTTVTLGVALRTSGRDQDIIGRQNGGNAHSVNGDNGNLNYNSGDLTSSNAKASHELQIDYKYLSAFGRFFYFYDHTIMNGDTQRTELTKRAEEEIGSDIQLRDAYVALDVPVGQSYLTIRGGNQVLSWGESTFIQNGIASINPIDVSKVRIAGAEVKEVFKAVPMVNVAFDINTRFSAEGFYQIQWDHTEIEPEGTFFSTNDFASPGGEYVLLGFGAPGIADNPALPGVNPPIGTRVPRINDRDAKDEGQFGIAVRWFEPNLRDTEFGFYFTQLHSRLPLISAITGTEIGLADLDYASTARFFREFPEEIKTYGFSFNTDVGWGSALQGEVSYRQDQPLQIDDVEILFAALTPLNVTTGDQLGDVAIFDQNQIGKFGFDENITGFRKKDVVQFQATASKLFGPGFGADQFAFVGEFGGTLIQDMESKDVLRYDGPGTYTSGNSFFTDFGHPELPDSLTGVQPATETDGFGDEASFGYRLLLRGEYNNAIGPMGVRPQLAWVHDISGTTPRPISNFIEGRKTITAAMTLNYLISWNLRLAYTNSFGGGRYNLLNDRDFFSGALSYAF